MEHFKYKSIIHLLKNMLNNPSKMIKYLDFEKPKIEDGLYNEYESLVKKIDKIKI